MIVSKLLNVYVNVRDILYNLEQINIFELSIKKKSQ